MTPRLPSRYTPPVLSRRRETGAPVAAQLLFASGAAVGRQNVEPLGPRLLVSPRVTGTLLAGLLLSPREPRAVAGPG